MDGSAAAAYLIVFLTAGLTTVAVTPVVRRLSIRLGAVDHPSDRKVHPQPTPTMGGIAMFAGFLAALAVTRIMPFFEEMNAGSPEPLAALVTCGLMLILGVIDDVRGVSWLAKLTAQIFIGGVLILLGVQLTYFWLPGAGVVFVDPSLSVPLTILWVAAVSNAVNLVDGLDGLAAGMVGIAAAGFFVYMVRTEAIFGDASAAALLSLMTVGICAGFLPWNFHRAKIFMGDSGSMLLGMLLSLATLSGIGRNYIRPAGGDLAAAIGTVAVPFLILAVPFLDVILAVVRRTWRRQGLGHADKEHLHHRLMDIGHSHRRAVVLMYLWSLLLTGSGLAAGLLDLRLTVGLVALGLLTMLLVTASPRLIRRDSSSGPRRGEPDAAVSATASERDGPQGNPPALSVPYNRGRLKLGGSEAPD